jgi:hypothetical protein
MSLLQQLKDIAAAGLTVRNAAAVAAFALDLAKRCRALFLADDMTEAQWMAAVKAESERLDAWKTASDAAEDKALRGG